MNSSGTEMTVETMLVVEHGCTLKETKNHETGKDVYIKSDISANKRLDPSAALQ